MTPRIASQFTLRTLATLATLVTLASLATLATTDTARAVPDTFGNGDGSDGALVLSAAQTVTPNAVHSHVTAAPAADTLTLDSAAGFGVGDLVLVWQATGLPEASAPSADQSALTLGDTLGAWELARVLCVDTVGGGCGADALQLSGDLERSYPVNFTQVVRVPQYTDVTVPATATLTADAWDGQSGGVVFFLASGTVNLDGRIDVQGAGFRPGVYVSTSQMGNNGCTDIDEPYPRGAEKGEGFVATHYSGYAFGAGTTYTGYGNRAQGGGGGVCHNSGGGGGGAGGQGGRGGRTWDEGGVNRDVGGRGGSRVSFSPLSHLAFGGGGGAGAANNNLGNVAGAGGGIVFIRAAAIDGAGDIDADGDTAPDAPGAGNDALSGGGAGGTVTLVSPGDIRLGDVTANGGNGGSSPFVRHGPGGGGGGGHVYIETPNLAYGTISAIGGQAGRQGMFEYPLALGGLEFGAGDGDPGTIVAPPACNCGIDGYCWNEGNQKPGNSCLLCERAESAAAWTRVCDLPYQGCSDGTREGFLGEADIAACAGGWDQPGARERITTCNYQAGNDARDPSGAYCALSDLCEEGWHVCESGTEVAARSDTGDCTGALVGSGLFYASRQSSDGAACTDPLANPGDENDVFGCGDLGTANACGGLDARFGTATGDCDGSGAWDCGGSSGVEAGRITKAGSTEGGVLCCRNVPVRIDAPADGSRTRDTTPDLSGAAAEDAALTLTIRDVAGLRPDVVYMANADAAGDFATVVADGDALPEGDYLLIVDAADTYGHASTGQVAFSVDLTAPVLTVSEPSAGLRNSGAFTPAGTTDAEVGQLVSVLIESAIGAALGTCSGRVSSGSPQNSWRCDAAVDIADGANHRLTAIVDDLAGNGGLAQLTLSIDSMPPAIAVTLPAAGTTLTDADVIPAGTTDEKPGSSVSVVLTDDGGTTVGTCSGAVLGDGTWACASAVNLPDGLDYGIEARVTDDAGNTGLAVGDFDLDTTGPVATFVSPTAGATLTADHITPAGDSDAPEGAVVTATLRDGPDVVDTCTATVQAGGGFACADALALPESTALTLTAEVDDAFGNAGGGTVAFDADRTGPAIAIATPADGVALNDGDLSPSGTTDAPAGSTVMVTARDAQGALLDSCSGDVEAGGAWRCDTAMSLPDGALHLVTAEAADAFGNLASDSVSVSIDSTGPALSIEDPADGAERVEGPLTPSGSTDAPAGSTVEVRIVDDGGAELGSCSATVKAGGAWRCEGVIDLRPGPGRTLTARVPDALGNETEASADFDVVAAPVPVDSDGDGIPDVQDPDDDDDGVLDVDEEDGDPDRDSDGDGTPDRLDPDSDDDGIPDAAEGNVDTDDDGTPDRIDLDSDDDGIPDAQEGNVDSDDDGTPDRVDLDSDDDGIPDADEGNGDSDADGVPDRIDLDSDNDGIPDADEGNGDADGDGLPNRIDLDSDGDGIGDLIEGGGDPTDDAGGDGRVDDPTDDNGDGLHDPYAATPLPLPDTDGDGAPDYLDADDDGDGIATDIERQAEQGMDVDGDGVPNHLDSDTDGDGIDDATEGEVDDNGDGVADFLQPPSEDGTVDQEFGYAGGALCATSQPGSAGHRGQPVTGHSALLPMLGVLLLLRRRRRGAPTTSPQRGGPTRRRNAAPRDND